MIGCGHVPETKSATARRKRVVIGGLALAYGVMMGLSALVMMPGEAMALRVTMKRIVFEGPKRADIIVLINNSNEEMAYRFGWRRMRMSEDKSLTPIEEGDAATDIQWAEDMVQFAPRRVVLPAGGSQQLRLMLRRPKDLPDGEYRAHFWIEPEAESVKFDPAEVKGDPSSGPAVQIKMLTGITLPVIVRAGNLTASAAISNGRVMRGGDNGGTVAFTLSRDGNRSLYGDFDFTCGSTVVHQVRGVAVYTEVTKRNLEFKLKALPADCRNLNVVYKATEDDALFAGGTMAEATIAVP
ncbi:MAG: hypothetical protein KKA05_03715 [Alphaproteobacteria bacterium]|nr:hypothetical protein [Alphaproteobacteria bacterium]